MQNITSLVHIIIVIILVVVGMIDACGSDMVQSDSCLIFKLRKNQAGAMTETGKK